MPKYNYKARDSAGNLVEGTLESATAEEASRNLRAAGKYPTQITAANDRAVAQTPVGGGVRVGRDEVIALCTQLSVMLETGVNLSEAVECCAMNANKPQSKKLLDDLQGQINAGVDLSTAMSRHPRSFPRLLVALVRASEKNGMMSKLLNRATAYMKDEQEILRKVKGALTYPCIMFGFALLTTIFLLIFVLPRFTTIYANKGAALPTPTKVLMAMSDFLLHQWMYLVPGLIVTAGVAWWYAKTPSGGRVLDWLILNLPMVGPMMRKLHLARGLRTVGTMVTSGVSLVDCVQTADDLCTNSYFRTLWADVQRQIENGRPFSDPLGQSKLVPGAVSRMIASGERGGRLGPVTEQVATFAEHELKEKITELTRYIEPAMIMAMGLLIGGVTLALLMPIFSISKVVAN
jgi:type IV pilus assembly protein PilC